MNYEVSDVFTPATHARVNFIDRVQVNDLLVDALRTPGLQIVVYGHSGSGKSSLLLKKLYELYESHITTKCHKSMTFEQIMLDAFDQLEPYFLSEKAPKVKANISTKILANYELLKTEISSVRERELSEKFIRGLPLQLTPSNLARFIGELGACWVIEDFHKIQETEKSKLSQVLKVFVDMASDYKSLKIIALGAVGTAREVIAYDEEMKNRISEIFVDLMTPEEVSEILRNGANLLNINFTPTVISKVTSLSCGLPSVCHHLALDMCRSKHVESSKDGLNQILDNKCLEESVLKYIQRNSDNLKHEFDKAVRTKRKGTYDNARIIIQAMSEMDGDSFSYNDIHSQIKNKYKDYPAGNLSTYLKELQTEDRSELIRFDENSNTYHFRDPFIQAFCKLNSSNLKSQEKPIKNNYTFEVKINSKSQLSLFKELNRILNITD